MKRRLISLFLVIGIMLCCSTMAFASNIEAENVCTQFKYTVLDKDGNVVETGVTPDFSVTTRASWSGITLSNGETAVFKPADGNIGFYILKDSRIQFEFELDRAASGVSGIHCTSDGTSREDPFRNIYGRGIDTPVFETGYYYGYVKSAYDGDFVISSAKFTWQ